MPSAIILYINDIVMPLKLLKFVMFADNTTSVHLIKSLKILLVWLNLNFVNLHTDSNYKIIIKFEKPTIIFITGKNLPEAVK